MRKKNTRLNRLEITAFVSGFVLMVFELAAARILAPGIGSSTYVWTSVIGVIIAALSLGYWIGGKLADGRGYMIDVARLTLLAGLGITLTIILYDMVISWVAYGFDDPRIQGVVASLILFAPVSVILGAISPYLAKLNVKSLETTGQSVASLSALNSIGGILGTFTAGFVLFSFIGSRETLAATAVAMVAVSWLAVPRTAWKIRTLATIGTVLIVSVPTPVANALSIDTPSARYIIHDEQGVRLLATGPRGAQSGVSLKNKDELAFWYTKELADIVAHAPKKDSILILGGGAFTLPRYLAEKYPDSSIYVVEIDPELANIARRYFYYDDPSNVKLHFTDARAYVNQTSKRYDIIIVDVYGDIQVPFTFLTKEYGDRIREIVTPQGLVAVNMVAGLKGECGELLETLNAPYQSHFAYREYKINSPEKARSNIVAAYSDQPFGWSGSRKTELKSNALYTDNFVPAERLHHGCLQQR